MLIRDCLSILYSIGICTPRVLHRPPRGMHAGKLSLGEPLDMVKDPYASKGRLALTGRPSRIPGSGPSLPRAPIRGSV